MKSPILITFTCLTLFWPVFAICAADTFSTDLYNRTINAISIAGNSRTNENVIRGELSFTVGQIFSHGHLVESKQRLQNLRIFSDVKIEIKEQNDGSINIQIVVEERWTTIPIFKFASGGASRFITIGAYDINILGRNLELGAQYENLNGEHSGVTWFRNPRFLGKKLLVGYDLWSTNRMRNIYNNDAKLVSAYTSNKQRIHFFVQKEYSWWIGLNSGIDYVKEKLSNFGLSDNENQANVDADFVFPAPTQQMFFDFSLRLGRLNYKNYLVNGNRAELQYQLARESLGSSVNSNRIIVHNKYFKTLFKNHNFGINFATGRTDSPLIQEQFYIGGLSEVRGFKDGQFVGKNYWQANVEYRLPSFTSPWLVVQHVGFIDGGNTAERFFDLLDGSNKIFYSFGTGIRFISPKIYRFNLRVDYAQTFGRTRGFDVAIGLQQFF